MKPLWLAFAQLDDPAIFGVLVRSVALTLLTVAGLIAASVWSVDAALADYAWPRWLADIVGTLGVALLAFWLFLPAVMLIATLFIERIAGAVDRRYYPMATRARDAGLAQGWDGVVLAVQILLVHAAGLVLALIVPGLGLGLALLISGWAIGRGLFVAVALRRMERPAAIALYRRQRLSVMLPGVALAAAASVPGLNLLVPVLGTAAMVHVLNRALGWPRVETAACRVVRTAP